MKQPFKLPQLNYYETDFAETDFVFNKMKNSVALMTFIKNSEEDYKFYYSGFGEDELAMLLILFDQNVQAFEFFKSAIVCTELYRIDGLQGFQYSASLVEYIKKK